MSLVASELLNQRGTYGPTAVPHEGLLRTHGRRALRLYKTFECENVEVSGTDAHFFLSYTMHIRFMVGPTLHIPMSTECRAKDGKVTQCRDYFDPMGALAATAAPAKQVYRRVIGLLVA